MATTLAGNLEVEVPKKKEFMAKFDRFEPAIRDHSALITAKTCLRKYFYQYVLARNSKESSLYLAWGSAYHKFREKLEIEYGFGLNVPKTFDKEKAVTAFQVAQKAGMDVWRTHGSTPPVGSKLDFMTPERLLKSFTVAFQHWVKEKQLGRIEVIAVEQPFNIAYANGKRTSGRADQIVRWNGKVYGRDFKTTTKDLKFYERTLEPNDQFTRYTWAEGKLVGETVFGMFVEVLFNSRPTKSDQKGPTITSFVTQRTQQQLDQWEKEQMHWEKILDLCRDEDIYPMQEVSCQFCPYHSVCTQASEGAMMAQLEMHYVVRPWNNADID